MSENARGLSEAEARAIMSRLGRAEGELAASFAIPVNWIVRGKDGRLRARNGTAFVMSAGQRVFGVTANHVLEGWRSDRDRHDVVALQLGDLPFEPDGRHAVIATHSGIDIATLQITREEVKVAGAGKAAGQSLDGHRVRLSRQSRYRGN
jgi:hypothetical protein